MVKAFKGQVKIADVQAAFDDIIGDINTMVSSYNSQSYVTDIDYTVGASTLGASGYCLTVGGLKQLMESCDGCVIGGKAYKISDNSIKMSTGALITKNGIYRLPDSVITPISGSTVYYNTATGAYQWTGQGSSEVWTYEDLGDSLELNKGIDSSGVEWGRIKQNKSAWGTLTPLLIGSYKYLSADSQTQFVAVGDEVTESDLSAGKFKIGTTLKYIPHIAKRVDTSSKVGYRVTYTAWPYNTIQFGTLDSDGYYTPKFNITTGATNYGANWGFNFAAGGTSDWAVEHTTGDDYDSYRVSWKFQSMTSKTVALGIPAKVEFRFGTDSSTKQNKVYCDFYDNAADALGGNPATTFDCTIPLSIDDYDINVVIFSKWYYSDTIGDTISGSTMTNRYAWRLADYYVDDVNLSAESMTTTVKVKKTVSGSNLAYRICDLNMNNSSKLVNNIRGCQSENINGTYKITVPARSWTSMFVNNQDYGYAETIDTSSSPKFVCGMEGKGDEGKGNITMELLDRTVSWNRQAGHRNADYWIPVNMLFLPQGVSNPYTFSNSNWNNCKSFTPTITKKIDSSETEEG